MNIPIFRAKKIDSEEYIIGYLKFDRKHNHYSINPIDDENTWYKVDVTTFAIHFPDMIDSQGNKIFASLQEDGKGGDRLIEDGRYEDGFNPVFEPYFRKSSFSIFDLPSKPSGEYILKYYKIIGIQQ